ncbi:hypothetical protein [Persicobacter psychrovividus]|uniref:Transposase n=1 Tax=Persicobacter psychrovividus TaxID=387638 RepID=A0ABM7VMJ0_9BACT|nr:hypothetical protein PEPS_42170 [Persicobacter psychrovividus]BDD02226.1 hypothetical protein PEPS_45060 [Persicobacter psychrovividus]
MQIKELKISAKEKRTAVQKYYVGLASKKKILEDYQICERTLKRWCWWYQQLIQTKYKTRPKMKKSDLPNDPNALKALVMQLQREKEDAQLKAEAMEILVDIGEQRYGMNLKKKLVRNGRKVKT